MVAGVRGGFANRGFGSGIGIEVEEQTAIFDESPVANAQRNRGEGLGLGLAITRRLVRAAAAQNRTPLQPGRGSVFRLDVPIAPRPDRVENMATATDGLFQWPTVWADAPCWS